MILDLREQPLSCAPSAFRQISPGKGGDQGKGGRIDHPERVPVLPPGARMVPISAQVPPPLHSTGRVVADLGDVVDHDGDVDGGGVRDDRRP